MAVDRIVLFAACGLGAFSLLLLIISVGIPNWLDDGVGNTVGLFRKCFASNATNIAANLTEGCVNENRVTQAGLSIFGLLLLVFSIIVGIVSAVKQDLPLVGLVSLGLMYFASMFVMSAYATFGTYARDPLLYYHPLFNIPAGSIRYTSMGPGYHLCVAAHYFLWTSLTLLAYAVGARSAARDQASGQS